MPSKLELEQMRGTEMAERYARVAEAMGLGNAPDPEVELRRETLRRWEDANKMHLMRQHHATNQLEISAFVQEVCVTMEIYSQDWPSAEFVGKVGIAIAALENFEGIPEKSARTREREAKAAHALQERQRKDENRRNVHNWSENQK